MDKLFQVHKLNENGMRQATVVAMHFDGLLELLSSVCSEGREFSIAKTKLEEACFYAKKALASNPANQE